MEPYCESGDGPQAEFLSIKTVKARKEHQCYECHATIPQGTLYERITGKWEGYVESFATCLICAKMRRDFAPYADFGSLDEVLCEYLDFEPDEIR